MVHSSPHRLAYVLAFGAISGEILLLFSNGGVTRMVADTTWGFSEQSQLLHTQTDYLILFLSSPIPPSLSSLSSPLLSSPLLSSPLLFPPFFPPSFPLFPPFLLVGFSAIIALFFQSLLYFPVFATIDTTIPILGYIIGFLYSLAL